MESQLLNQKGEKIGKVELPEAVFGLRPSPQFLHEVVTASEANRRAGTAHTKTRAEVSGGGRKPWRQKGTGRARVGSSRTPLWRGGGVIFGPSKERNFYQRMPAKTKYQAFQGALLAKAQAGAIYQMDLPAGINKTADAARQVPELDALRRALLIVSDLGAARALRNLPNVWVVSAARVTALNILSAQSIVLVGEGKQQLLRRINRSHG